MISVKVELMLLTPDTWIAYSPDLDVIGHGRTKDAAKRNFNENLVVAIHAFGAEKMFDLQYLEV